MNIKKIIETAGLQNSMFTGHHSFNKYYYGNITIPDMERILKRRISDDLAQYILKINDASFVIEARPELDESTMEIELVILTKDELKRLINVCIKL